ncbi:MAG: glycosyltransferase family 4 protein [bacterium]|nr:glycosyltransferase family 4 protein [bacterium]
MNIGIYIGGQDVTIGGEATLEHSIVHALLDVDTNHTLFLLYSNENNTTWERANIKFINLHGMEVLSRLVEIIVEEKIDFMWFTGPYYIPVPIPYLITVWDLAHRVHPYFPEVSIKDWKWTEREKIYHYLLPRASYIITGNSTGRKEIMDFYGVPEERIKILPFPVPQFALEYEKYEYIAEGEKLELPEKYLFYPANFWPHKNHIMLLHMLKKLNEVHDSKMSIIFTGSDHGNLRYVKQVTQELGISQYVKFLGFVSIEEMIYIYKNAFALVFPSFFGPNNLPPLEACALGCPVIASGLEGHKEQLGDAALYADPTNEDEFAARVKLLIDEHGTKETLIANGHKLAQSWTSKDYVQGVCDIFDDFALIQRCWANDDLIENLESFDSISREFIINNIEQISEIINIEIFEQIDKINEDIDKITKSFFYRVSWVLSHPFASIKKNINKIRKKN